MYLPVLHEVVQDIMAKDSEFRKIIETGIVLPFEIKKAVDREKVILDQDEITALVVYLTGENYSKESVKIKFKQDICREVFCEFIYELYLHLLVLLFFEYAMRKIADDFSPWGLDSFVNMLTRKIYSCIEIDYQLHIRAITFVESVIHFLGDYTLVELHELYRDLSIKIGENQIMVRDDEIVNRFLSLQDEKQYVFRIYDLFEKKFRPSEYIFGIAVNIESVKKMVVIEEIITNVNSCAVTCLSNTNSFGRLGNIMRLTMLKIILQQKYYELSDYPFCYDTLEIFFDSMDVIQNKISKQVMSLLKVESESIWNDTLANNDLIKMYTLGIECYTFPEEKMPIERHTALDHAIDLCIQQRYDVLHTLNEAWMNLRVMLSGLKYIERGEIVFDDVPKDNAKLAFVLSTVNDNMFGYERFPLLTLLMLGLLTIKTKINDNALMISEILTRTETIMGFVVYEYRKATYEIYDYICNAEYTLEGIGKCGFQEYIQWRRMRSESEDWENDYKREKRNNIWALENLKQYNEKSLNKFFESIQIAIANKFFEKIAKINYQLSNFNESSFNRAIKEMAKYILNNFNEERKEE